jgi:signal transduction histidine kinase
MPPTRTGEVESWLGSLEWLAQGQPPPAPAFVKPFHFVTTALTAKRTPGLRSQALRLPEDLESYAERMNLWDAAGLHPPVQRGPRRNPRGSFMPAEALYTDEDVHRVTNALVEISPAETGDRSRDSLGHVIHELVENCVNHSRPDIALHGLCCAQAWRGGNRAQVAIADPGIGIRSALERNRDLDDALAAENACLLATRWRVTGSPEASHSGQGLYTARQALEQNGGRLLVISRNEGVACGPSGAHAIEISTAWHGTLLVIEWRLDRPLDIVSVYEQLPGADDDDFDF